MSVSVHDLHRLTATAVEHHKALHRSHHHVARQVAADRNAQAASAAGLQHQPLSGTAGGSEGSRPPGGA